MRWQGEAYRERRRHQFDLRRLECSDGIVPQVGGQKKNDNRVNELLKGEQDRRPQHRGGRRRKQKQVNLYCPSAWLTKAYPLLGGRGGRKHLRRNSRTERVVAGVSGGIQRFLNHGNRGLCSRRVERGEKVNGGKSIA